ncbi:MAG: cupin domain-containing protein [Chloroflexota bacterium]
MDAFECDQLMDQQQQSGRSWLEFLRVPSLSAGVYHLSAGGADLQQPHTEDEVYYVVSGSASIRVGEESRSVKAGSIVYVAANVEHRFFDISEDLTVLVFFAPAEYSRSESYAG